MQEHVPMPLPVPVRVRVPVPLPVQMHVPAQVQVPVPVHVPVPVIHIMRYIMLVMNRCPLFWSAVFGVPKIEEEMLKDMIRKILS